MKKENSYELEERYLTQEEVARRFRVSPSTIKNWRDQGKLDFLRPDWSSRVLYPKESIEEFEKRYTKKAKVLDLKKYAEIKREVHGMSSDPKEKDRRI